MLFFNLEILISSWKTLLPLPPLFKIVEELVNLEAPVGKIKNFAKYNFFTRFWNFNFRMEKLPLQQFKHFQGMLNLAFSFLNDLKTLVSVKKHWLSPLPRLAIILEKLVDLRGAVGKIESSTSFFSRMLM